MLISKKDEERLKHYLKWEESNAYELLFEKSEPGAYLYIQCEWGHGEAAKRNASYK